MNMNECSCEHSDDSKIVSPDYDQIQPEDNVQSLVGENDRLRQVIVNLRSENNTLRELVKTLNRHLNGK